MTGCRDHFHLNVTTNSTGIGNRAVHCASRLHSDGLIVVAHCYHLISNIAVTASSTGVGSITYLSTSWGSCGGMIIMSLRRHNAIIVVITASTAVVSSIAGNQTVRFNHNAIKTVSQSIHCICHKLIATMTGIDRISRLSAVGCCYHSLMVVSSRRNVLLLNIATGCTSIGNRTILSAGSIYSHSLIAVTRCRNLISNIAGTTNSADVGSVTNFSASRSGYHCLVIVT